MTPEEKKQISECSRSHPHENMGRDCIFRTTIARLTNHLANKKSELDKANARIAQLEDALDAIKWHRKSGSSPTKYEYEIEVLAAKALNGSSDTWLSEHDKAVEVRVLEEIRGKTKDIYGFKV